MKIEIAEKGKFLFCDECERAVEKVIEIEIGDEKFRVCADCLDNILRKLEWDVV